MIGEDAGLEKILWLPSQVLSLALSSLLTLRKPAALCEAALQRGPGQSIAYGSSEAHQ